MSLALFSHNLKSYAMVVQLLQQATVEAGQTIFMGGIISQLSLPQNTNFRNRIGAHADPDLAGHAASCVIYSDRKRTVELLRAFWSYSSNTLFILNVPTNTYTQYELCS